MRKIIQIAALPQTEGTYETIFALRDDGSIYKGHFENNQYGVSELKRWKKLPPIQQDEDEES